MYVSRGFNALFFVALAFYVIPSVEAQDNQQDLKWKHISNGLSHNRVTDLLQDHQGFLWVATYSGLNRYDGQHFQIFQQIGNDPTSLPDNDISSLLQDRTGELWVGTGNGLARFIREKDHFEVWNTDSSNPDKRLINSSITTLYETKNQELWIGSVSGINVLSPNREIVSTKSFEELEGLEIWGFLEDHRNRIFITTNMGIFIYSPESHTIVAAKNHSGETITGFFKEIIQAQDRTYWLTTERRGVLALREISDTHFEVTEFNASPSPNRNIGNIRVNSVFEGPNGNIWIGAENAGLSIYNPNQDRLYRHQSDRLDPNSISSNSIWDIYKDSAGRIWLGTFNKGLSVLDDLDKKFVHEKQNFYGEEGLANDAVTSFIEVGEEIWIGTDGGGISLWNRNKQQYSHLKNEPGQSNTLASNAVLDLFQQKNGQIWVGTWAGGLNLYLENGKFQAYTNQPDDPTSIPSNMVFAIDEDRENNLWVAFWNRGIARFNPSDGSFFTINTLTYGESLWETDLTNHLLIDSQNIFWVASETGLNKLTWNSRDDFQVTSYLHDPENPSSISHSGINQVFEDHKGRIWACTGSGLNLYRPSTDDFQRFDQDSGLPGNFIQSIIQDPKNDFWVTTNKGLSKMTGNDSSWTFRNFDQTDGVQGDNFIRGASYMTSDQTILLGGTNGFNHFTMDMVRANPYPPIVQFTELRIFNQAIRDFETGSILKNHINSAETIVLDHQQNVFSIEYIGVSLTHGNKNQYAYRLLGLESEWNEVGTQTTASYSNLEPGEYTFQVKAANNDGLWSETPRSIIISVLPPWWATWWFRSFSLLLLAVTIGSIIYTRSRQVRANENRLKEEVAKAVEEVNLQKERIQREKEKLQMAVLETHEIVTTTINSGNFHERVSTEGKEDEWLDLARSINTLFESILKPFALLNQTINAVSKGDLTPRIEDQFSGDTGTVTQNLNLALENLSGFIGDISASIVTIQQASLDMKGATDELQVVSNEITSAIGEMSSGAKQQLQRVDQSFQLTEDILKFSGQMGKLASSINESANQGSAKSQKGKEMVASQNSIMGEIGQISAESNASMRHLEKRSMEISSIIGIMKEIASQTNLLALNAAIEAAQAGEAGRGFSVVAAEIRKLAVDSKKSAGMIEELIVSIQEETAAMANLMKKMDGRVSEGVSASEETNEVLGVITQLYNETVIASEQISEATERQIKDIQGISGIMEEVVVISEQTAAGAEEVHSSAERVSGQMNEFTDRSERNLQVAEELMKKSANFTLDKES